MSADLTKRCVDTVRVLAADMVEKANSGHPGAPMGCAPMAHVLYSEIMRFNPSNPQWFNRDRFVLSNGHACALQYSMMHLVGFGISIEDLKKFRQLGSLTPGHPENAITPGVEVSSGPLGQGISNAVGIAMAERHLAAVYNREGFNVVDHYTYVICGDGCMQEGIASEACSLAGHHGLGKLIVLYDDNNIQIDGDTSLCFTEDVQRRFEAYGWHVQRVADGDNDVAAIKGAVENAKSVGDKPSLIMVKTVIGYGSSKAGSAASHGAPLGSTDLAAVKQKFNFDPAQSFVIPEEVRGHYASRAAEAALAEVGWKQLFSAYEQAHPQLAQELTRRMSGELPMNWEEALPGNPPAGTKAAATRNYSGDVLNALAGAVPELVGGSADLSGSNCSNIKGATAFQKGSPEGKVIYFGVREHAMAAICNGMFAHGGIRPFCATFLNFIGYALGAVRCAALSQMGILYVMTHDSIGLGEDGPTHQPIEMLESLRAMPNLHVFRPADREEVKGSYTSAMQQRGTPSVLSLSRQSAPALQGTSAEQVARRGGYIIEEMRHNADALAHPTLVLIGTGTELSLAVDVAKKLFEEYSGADSPCWLRVVSMACCDIFDEQPLEYRQYVLPKGSPAMSIEAASVHGWRRYVHAPFGIDNSFGYSAPGGALYTHFGFTVDNLTQQARGVVKFYTAVGATHPVAPSLLDVFQFPTPPKLH